MTEFKKLVALTDTFRHDVDTLERAASAGHVCEHDTDGDILSLQQTATRVKEAIAEGIPRMRKIALKARETDPNKQIFNETMCTKIEALFQSYCDILSRLFPSVAPTPSPAVGQGVETEESVNTAGAPDSAIAVAVLQTQPPGADPFAFENAPWLEAVEDAYNTHVLQLAKQEAWQARVAVKLDDAALFESQGRAVLLAEEKTDRALLIEQSSQGKLHIQIAQRERDEATRRAEEERRKNEHDELHTAAGAVAPGACGTFIQTSLPPDFHKVLACRLHGLVRALIATPEDVNIRKLRNNNAQFLHDFGGIGLRVPERQQGETCVCGRLARTAEVLLYRIGYRIRYTGKGTPSPIFLVSEQEIADVTLPCGEPLSRHLYTPLGFESYSERYLELSEPDARLNPDTWMTWYSSLQEIEASLKLLT